MLFGHTSAPQRWRGAAAALAAAALVGGAAGTAQAAPAADPLKNVSYLGHAFSVPENWPVVDLTTDPTACVRFDRHAVYLGTPGAEQNCPAGLTGRTEALLVEPAADGGAAGTTVNALGHEVVAEAPGIRATGTYDTDQALVRRVLASAGLPTGAPKGAPAKGSPSKGAQAKGSAPAAGAPLAGAPAAAAATLSSAAADLTNYTGLGFDACTAPDNTLMDAWVTGSPYRAVGVYIGGARRACAQPNLTASWVQRQANAGWKFLPLYAGTQAHQIVSPDAEGRAAADDAATQAAALGFGTGSLLYFNMESYKVDLYSAKVLPFVSAWSARLHELGYNAGYYSSSSTGIADLVAHQGSGYTMPDALWTANWNNDQTTNDPRIPASLWANHQRVHQFQGNIEETWGNRKLPIDQNYLDVQLSARTPGRSLVGVYRPSTRQFFTADANGGVAGSTTFGDPGDRPLTGDWNGDGRDTIGIFRPSTNLFALSNDQGSTVAVSQQLGTTGEVPVVGDWDGNGTDTIGVFRPSDAKFFLTNDNATVSIVVAMGNPNDVPVIGDWNGDGRDTIGVYRPSAQTFYLSDTNAYGQVDHQLGFGNPGDTPIVGDWDGDGTDQVGVFRGSEVTFYGAAKDYPSVVYNVGFGNPGDKPITGRW
ncbi:glycoside hydrolase domain-containing protein [Kitasatospora sp. NPDC057692]|uniref:glycoside hydrolase domain-containing protein n=1 Tax=Kitasatospora sp. NPDC057692 TaxID=3346215 RepID=UPI0036C25436